MIVTVLSGLALGSVYALIAFGFNLTWLTTRAVNFAQGAFVVAGMFIVVACTAVGLNPIITLVILTVVGAAVAALEYTVAIRPVQKRGDHAELVTTVGVMTVIQGVLLLLLTQDAEKVPPLVPDVLIDVPGGRIAPSDFLLIASAIVVGLGLHWWTRRTRSGLAAMGISQDREAAQVLGVNTLRFSYLSFMASGILGFVGAMVIGPKTFAVVAIAATLTIKGFIALAIGGLGNSLGALTAGLVLGLVEILVARLLGSTWQNVAIFILFITVMMIRPRGLLGEKQERVV